MDVEPFSLSCFADLSVDTLVIGIAGRYFAFGHVHTGELANVSRMHPMDLPFADIQACSSAVACMYSFARFCMMDTHCIALCRHCDLLSLCLSTICDGHSDTECRPRLKPIPG